MLTTIRSRLSEDHDDDDDGMTLIELLVAMGIFGVLLSIFMAAVVQMTHVTVRVDNTQAGQAELSRAFSRLDHTLRYADSVNYPVKSGSGNWYLEYRTTASYDGGPATCTQYQLNTTAQTFAYRTWTDGDLGTVTPWSVTASRIVNSTTEPPFTLSPAGGINRNQVVGIDLITQRGTATQQQQQLDTSIVALNSSIDSPSNQGSGSPIASTTPVCNGIGRA